MFLYEHEGKSLLRRAGIGIPRGVLMTAGSILPWGWEGAAYLKAQVLSGKRASAGGIVKLENREDLTAAVSAMNHRQINGESVDSFLVEEVITYKEAWYFALSYSTDSRSPILTWSTVGGVGVEDRESKTVVIDPLDRSLPDGLRLPRALVTNLMELFFREDCLLLEINPLVYGTNGDGETAWYALDAKISLDESSFGRHPDRPFLPFGRGCSRSEREVAAKKIDAADHRGTAGSVFVELPGDIAFLASGGGASLLALDSLISVGGHPANYTEYSGNPPREKVEKLTEIVLSKSGLNGLWVVGAIANFTDVFETLSGVLSALRVVRSRGISKVDFPIVVRRSGPRDAEGLALLRAADDFDFHVFGAEVSIAQSASLITDLAKKFAQKNPR